MKFIALCFIFFSPCLYAEVVHSADDGFELKMSVSVPATPDQAYQQFLKVNEWWSSAHTWWGDASNLSIDPQAGGCFCERSGDRSAMHMTVAYVDPGKEIRLLGGLGPLQKMGLQGVLTFKFIPSSDNKTTIVQEYRVMGYDPDGLKNVALIVDEVQTAQLHNLESRFKSRH